MNGPFLIDECLTPDLAALAHKRGHHATHVLFHGLQGTNDRGLMPMIRAERFVPVTGNACDFVRLYRQEQLHPGLIVILPGHVRGHTQLRLFGLALDVVEPLPDLINELVGVDIGDWPPS